MKNCKICNNEFEQKTNRGSEQLYCSDKCRQQGYLQRKASATTGATPSNGVFLQNPNHLQARFNATGEVDRTNFTNFGVNLIEQLEKTYEAKTEALKWQMKFESIAKEVEDIKTKNNVLTMQLETMDDDTDNNEGGFLGSIVKNPQPLIILVNYAIDKYFELQKIKQPIKTA
jgi:hypothetical protein